MCYISQSKRREFVGERVQYAGTVPTDSRYFQARESSLGTHDQQQNTAIGSPRVGEGLIVGAHKIEPFEASVGMSVSNAMGMVPDAFVLAYRFGRKITGSPRESEEVGVLCGFL